jgi:hypothetical protein
MKNTVKNVARVGRPPVVENNVKIVVLAKGKVNPRTENTGPWVRYNAVLKSKTVGDFLKKMPKWRTTLYRAKREGLIKLVAA